MNYDDWKTTDPADADPDRENRCRFCGDVECDFECSSVREKNEDDGMEYGHPSDRLAGRE